jgi:hypothetical protein
VVTDALDRVPVQLKLGDHDGREVNPAGVKIGKSDGLVAGLAQSFQQPLLLGVSAHHDRIVALRDCGTSSVSTPRCCHWTFGELVGCSPPILAPRRGRLQALWIVATGVASSPPWTPTPTLHESRCAFAPSGQSDSQNGRRRSVMLV